MNPLPFLTFISVSLEIPPLSLNTFRFVVVRYVIVDRIPRPDAKYHNTIIKVNANLNSPHLLHYSSCDADLVFYCVRLF